MRGRSGRPLFSVIALLAFGPIAYISVGASGPMVFNWLL
jgi:amino acid transporter